MKKTIVVVDGMGGGLGAQLVERVRALAGDRLRIIALGTNSSATERMLKAGADRGASGDNAIRTSVGLGDVILGPIGIVIPNGLMGEISTSVAEAILAARGRRVLVPVPQDHFKLIGLEGKAIAALIAAAAEAGTAEAAAGTGETEDGGKKV